VKGRTSQSDPAPPVAAFDLGRLAQPLRGFYQNLLSLARSVTREMARWHGTQHLLAEVRAVCASDRGFDAHAESAGGHHQIVFSCALPCLLHFCFNNVLRLPFVFPQMGAARSERRYREAFNEGIPLALPADVPLKVSLDRLPSISRPRDFGRAFAASALTEMAAAFCVLHEVGHVVGGHTGYLARRGDRTRLAELSLGTTVQGRSQALRRSWEFDADLLGASFLASYLLADDDTRAHFSEAFQVSSEEARYILLARAVFALGILFHYMGQTSTRLATVSHHAHPFVRLAAVRQVLFAGATHQRGPRLDPRRLKLLFQDASNLAGRAWLELGLQMPALHGRGRVDVTVNREHRSLIRSTEQLRPRYQRWCFFPLSRWMEPEAIY
jgi:hypothetical protein